MKRRWMITLVSAGSLLVGFGCYRLGLSVGTDRGLAGTDAVLASVQANLGLNNLERLRELEADLARGCSKEALAKVRFSIDLQMDVLASLYRDHKGTWAMEDLIKRDPSMLAQLEGFKKKYGQAWTEPKCSG